jgi:hypothetical protein
MCRSNAAISEIWGSSDGDCSKRSLVSLIVNILILIHDEAESGYMDRATVNSFDFWIAGLIQSIKRLPIHGGEPNQWCKADFLQTLMNLIC